MVAGFSVYFVTAVYYNPLNTSLISDYLGLK